MNKEENMLSEAKSPRGDKKTAQTKKTTPAKVEAEPVKVTKTSPMANKTLLLIVGLTIITIILLALALYIRLPKINPSPKVLRTTLSISKPVLNGSTYTANIVLTTERPQITTARIEIAYDPKTITSVDIKPGKYFNNPAILFKRIDPVKGTISYDLGINLGQKPVNGNGTVAILTFTSPVKSGTTTISFLPKSNATAVGVIHSILTNAVGVKFRLGE